MSMIEVDGIYNTWINYRHPIIDKIIERIKECNDYHKNLLIDFKPYTVRCLAIRFYPVPVYELEVRLNYIDWIHKYTLWDTMADDLYKEFPYIDLRQPGPLIDFRIKLPDDRIHFHGKFKV